MATIYHYKQSNLVLSKPLEYDTVRNPRCSLQPSTLSEHSLYIQGKTLEIRPKLKKCLFPSPDRPLENVATWNIFWWSATTFFHFWGNRKSWAEIPILFQNLRSELVYTFKWTKSVARLWRNQICEWIQHLNKRL